MTKLPNLTPKKQTNGRGILVWPTQPLELDKNKQQQQNKTQMAQGNGPAASEAAAVAAVSSLQHMNFRHEGEAVNQEQPEHILGKDY